MEPKLLTTLRDYSFPQFTADALAGVTVAMVAIPLSIAIAIASGAPPAVGLVTAIVGGLLISALGGSRVQIGGPTGAFIVVVYSIIVEFGYDGLVLATLMAGMMLVIAGFLRAGNLVAYVPQSVVHGFTIGIGVIIGASQLKDFLGLEIDNVPADFVDKIEVLWGARDTFNAVALAIGFAALVLIVLLRKLSARVPGPIIAVALVSATVALFGLDADSISSRYGDLPRGLPAPELPKITLERITELLPSAFVIAFLAAIDFLRPLNRCSRQWWQTAWWGVSTAPMPKSWRKAGPISARRFSADCRQRAPLPAPPPMSAQAGARRLPASSTQ